MRIGLLLEGGGMRGLYTAGVLDVFMDKNIEVDGIVGVSAGALFGMNYKSKQKGRALRYNKKYLDGGIADSIPIDKIMSMNYDKVIVVLTRPKDYRKKKKTSILAKMYYRKYPNFIKTIETRYQKYNEELDKVLKLEREGKIFAIRPSKFINIKRTEKNLDIIQAMYDLGQKDALESLEALESYIK